MRRFVFGLLVFAISVPLVWAEDGPPLARQVTIHRDEWGVPHIDGPTDEAVVFGFGYAQAEDFLWHRLYSLRKNFILSFRAERGISLRFNHKKN